MEVLTFYEFNVLFFLNHEFGVEFNGRRNLIYRKIIL